MNSREEVLDLLDNYEKIYFPVITWKTDDNRKGTKPPEGFTGFTKSLNVPDDRALGVLTGELNNLSVIDLDDDESIRIWEDMCNMFEEDGVDKYPYSVKTGKGYHIYYAYNGEKKKTKVLKVDGKIINIDLIARGGFVYAPSTLHPVTNTYYEFIDDDLDFDNLPIIPKWFIDRIGKPLNEDYEIIETSKPKITGNKNVLEIAPSDKQEQLKAKLDLLNDTLDSYEPWLNLGMAIHNLELRGEITDGLKLWDEVSAKSNAYECGACELKWNTFGGDKDEKLGWSFINECCKKDNLEKYQELLNQLIPQMKEEEFLEWKPKVCHINNYKKLFMTACDLDTAIDISRKFSSYFITCSQGLKLEIFILSHDDTGENTYWEIKDFHQVSKTFSKYSRTFEKTKVNLLEEIYTIQVDETRIDTSKPLLFNHGKLKIFNRYEAPKYNPSYVLKYIREETFTNHMKNNFTLDQTNKAIETHLFNLCNKNHKDATWLKNWISSVFLIPNFKPLCWPILIGSIGCGKTTFINKIFREYMGNAFALKDDGRFAGNGSLAPLIGKTFGICDEIKVSTKEDYNKLKTLVTEKFISVEQKFKDPKSVSNIINMIFTSNHSKPILFVLPNKRRFAYFQAAPKVCYKNHP